MPAATGVVTSRLSTKESHYASPHRTTEFVTAMKYLMERETGYDNVEGLGFPSIEGCMAIVYQVSDGIFGLHNYGNSANSQFDTRAKKWSEWVMAHSKGKSPGLALYGVTFARSNARGYSFPPVGNWKAELKTFAARLGHSGPIFGYDLSLHFKDRTPKPSAYVEFFKQGSGFSIFVREWYKGPKDGFHQTAYVASTDFKNLDSTTSKLMTDAVDRSGLARVYPERLGGGI